MCKASELPRFIARARDFLVFYVIPILRVYGALLLTIFHSVLKNPMARPKEVIEAKGSNKQIKKPKIKRMNKIVFMNEI